MTGLSQTLNIFKRGSFLTKNPNESKCRRDLRKKKIVVKCFCVKVWDSQKLAVDHWGWAPEHPISANAAIDLHAAARGIHSLQTWKA
jgi:hypothetical protein